MAAAEAAGGDVVGVLADALGRRLREPETRRAIGDERVCLCTPYSPTARFSAGRAMGRNRLIYALTDVTFVVASDHDSGGTWSGAVEAVKHGFTRVAVWRGPGEGPGNSPLVERGATAIRDLDELAAMLAATEAGAAARPGPPAEHRVEQLGLTL
jgi:predicted Rossmann fold nucleotide-binding protein DprA/Smf involved in DNA uptake